MRIEICEVCGKEQTINDGLPFDHIRPAICDECGRDEAILDEIEAMKEI